MDDDMNPMDHLRALTPARVALGRKGCSLPTSEVLAFRLAHAQARDAVLTPADFSSLKNDLHTMGLLVQEWWSAASDRALYVARPDLGRQLAKNSAETIYADKLSLVICDGLSGKAVDAWAAPVTKALLGLLAHTNLCPTHIHLVHNGRVAIGDEIAERCGAQIVVVLIGERPGLGSADSLGAYITFAPKIGTTDAMRNCISNIRATGLSPHHAAAKIAWFVQESLRRQLSGTALKDDSNEASSLLRNGVSMLAQ